MRWAKLTIEAKVAISHVIRERKFFLVNSENVHPFASHCTVCSHPNLN